MEYPVLFSRLSNNIQGRVHPPNTPAYLPTSPEGHRRLHSHFYNYERIRLKLEQNWHRCSNGASFVLVGVFFFCLLY